MSQYLQGRGKMQEKSLSIGQRNLRNHLKDPIRESEETGQALFLSSSKETHCAPAEWKGKVFKSLMLSNPSRLADEHNYALNTQISTQM